LIYLHERSRYILYLFQHWVFLLSNFFLLLLNGCLHWLVQCSFYAGALLVVNEVNFVCKISSISEAECHVAKGFNIVFARYEVCKSIVSCLIEVISGHLSEVVVHEVNESFQEMLDPVFIVQSGDKSMLLINYSNDIVLYFNASTHNYSISYSKYVRRDFETTNFLSPRQTTNI
jgi:hypothetical protein